MANERFTEALRELGVLYSKAKRYILRAEQIDPESRSNIAIFKEQRDALDHIMRALWAYFENDQDENYLCVQIEKARGHLFRAAYDALDGAGISFKLRIAESMYGISNEAIAAVYPDYYEHVVEINQIDLQIVEHRRRKDIGSTTMKNMDDYSAVIDRLGQLSDIVTKKIPAFQEWQGRNRRKNVIWLIAVPTALVLLGFLLAFLKDLYLRQRDQVERRQSTAPQMSPALPIAPFPSPAASASSTP